MQYRARMTDSVRPIRFSALLLRPATPPRATWSFVVLPQGASRQLPSRGPVAVQGRFNGVPFQATLQPDGQGSHWLKIERALRGAAGASVKDEIAIELVPATDEPEPSVPADLRKALAGDAEARRQWHSLTPAARRDWVQWLASAKRVETRERRVAGACDMLAKGKRRICCFDRSGIYSKAFSAPQAAD